MKDRRLEYKERPSCAEKYSPVPGLITCPDCGEESELWSDEVETTCHSCGSKVFREEKTTH